MTFFNVFDWKNYKIILQIYTIFSKTFLSLTYVFVLIRTIVV